MTSMQAGRQTGKVTKILYPKPNVEEGVDIGPGVDFKLQSPASVI